MKDEYIAVMDSGIGGLSVLYKLAINFPNERFLYFGDNGNAPYGELDKRSLRKICFDNISVLMNYGIKGIVLACNTLSVNLRREAEDFSGVKIFGVFPPVESELEKNRKVLLLGTNSTCKNYKGIENLYAVGLKELASDIENKAMRNKLTDLNFDYHISQAIKEPKNYKIYDADSVILGCTHYFFIKNKIFDHFGEKIYLDGSDNTVNQVSKYYKTVKSSGFTCKNRILFIGDYADYNSIFFDKWLKAIKK